MIKQKLFASILFSAFVLFSACAQQETIEKPTEKLQTETQKSASVHSFGGWYCPDNLGGFPPVNVADLSNVPVVKGRMPTQEEARNGTSLMYFDPEKYPTAKPLEMNWPRLAYYFTESTQQTELVIIIQAVVVDEDTVVGFRYANGGNGTSWYNQVDLLTENEAAALGSQPFVYFDTQINLTKKEFWNAFAQTDYAKNLAERFDKKAFFEAEWTNHSRTELHYELIDESANGVIMSLFGNLYLQIDNEYNGMQTVEKILVLENKDERTSSIQVVFGPYTKDYAGAKAHWENWLQELRTLSKAK